MKITYHAKTEEIIDLNLRSLNRSPVAARWRRNTAIRLGLITGVVAFLLVPGGILTRLGVALFFIGVAVGIYLFSYPVTAYRRTRDIVLNRYRETNGSEVEIELRDSGLWTLNGETQIEFSWSNVAEVVDEPTVIEIPMKDGGLVVVQKRAFMDGNEISKFIELVKARMG